jgi:hypothetical protein
MNREDLQIAGLVWLKPHLLIRKPTSMLPILIKLCHGQETRYNPRQPASWSGSVRQIAVVGRVRHGRCEIFAVFRSANDLLPNG